MIAAPSPVEPLPVQPGPARPPIQVVPPEPVAPVVTPPPEATAPVAAPVTPATFNPAQAFTTVRETFAKLQETPKPAELGNAMEFMRRGFSAEDAVAKVIAKRPAVPESAAAALAKRFGTPSDTEVAKTVAAKNARTTRAKGGTQD
jgi:hypothetical protein